MVEFITQTRLLLNKRAGFFDKFTGDGFLAYFNETICRAAGTNYFDSCLEFLDELLEFSSAHFSDWTREVKKLPAEPIGLAIGADLGVVSFQNLNHHLIAVGDAVVWASRMASSARAGEIVVNNLLFESLHDKSGIQFEERHSKTKSGEGFMAHTLLFQSPRANH
jgi:class 3 adenylate cyclase